MPSHLIKGLKRNKVIGQILQLGYLSTIAEKGRFISCILIDIFNLAPDLFVIARLRALLLLLIGVKINAPGSSLVRKNFFVEFPNRLSIGPNCFINRNVYLCGNANITIGSNVRIAPGVKIITISHSNSVEVLDMLSPVVVKDYCQIYTNAVILPGTVLENGVTVGAGSVISGMTKPGGVYIGNPAKLVSISNLN